MSANFIKVGLLLVRMFSAGEAVEFIKLDVLSRNARDDFLVSGFGLDAGPINPLLYRALFHSLAFVRRPTQT
jgi:hypothetical protein